MMVAALSAAALAVPKLVSVSLTARADQTAYGYVEGEVYHFNITFNSDWGLYDWYPEGQEGYTDWYVNEYDYSLAGGLTTGMSGDGFGAGSSFAMTGSECAEDHYLGGYQTYEDPDHTDVNLYYDTDMWDEEHDDWGMNMLDGTAIGLMEFGGYLTAYFSPYQSGTLSTAGADPDGYVSLYVDNGNGYANNVNFTTTDA